MQDCDGNLSWMFVGYYHLNMTQQLIYITFYNIEDKIFMCQQYNPSNLVIQIKHTIEMTETSQTNNKCYPLNTDTNTNICMSMALYCNISGANMCFFLLPAKHILA